MSTLDRRRGTRIAIDKTAMQRLIPAKVTYGFLILALGMMLTDFCKLMRAPVDGSLTAGNGIHRVHKI